VTIVSPIVWTDLEGTMNVLALRPGPSSIELNNPDPKAKKMTRYDIAIISDSLGASLNIIHA
jgi:hypothetical protein